MASRPKPGPQATSWPHTKLTQAAGYFPRPLDISLLPAVYREKGQLASELGHNPVPVGRTAWLLTGRRVDFQLEMFSPKWLKEKPVGHHGLENWRLGMAQAP